MSDLKTTSNAPPKQQFDRQSACYGKSTSRDTNDVAEIIARVRRTR